MIIQIKKTLKIYLHIEEKQKWSHIMKYQFVQNNNNNNKKSVTVPVRRPSVAHSSKWCRCTTTPKLDLPDFIASIGTCGKFRTAAISMPDSSDPRSLPYELRTPVHSFSCHINFSIGCISALNSWCASTVRKPAGYSLCVREHESNVSNINLNMFKTGWLSMTPWPRPRLSSWMSRRSCMISIWQESNGKLLFKDRCRKKLLLRVPILVMIHQVVVRSAMSNAFLNLE